MAFRELWGHENQIDVLKKAMANNRVAHAYLFYGMAGVGKKTAALAFAKTLNCMDKKDDDACGVCLSCRKVVRDSHPDIVKIETKGQFIRIQEIRDIQNQMQFKPFEGAVRVIIICDADKMNIASANALLKTLEEPSAGNILILTTARFNQLPMTILSRCQHLRFNPLSRELISDYLQKQSSVNPETADRLASSAGGSIGRAIEMNKEAYARDRDDIFNMLVEARQTNLFDMLFFIGDLASQSKTVADKLNLMKTCFRDALVFRETGEQNRLIHYDRLDVIKTLGERLSGWDILNNIQAVDEALRAIEHNANKQLTLEAMMFRLALK
jgi:DNA polymerase-3 subunit delta'